MSSIFDLEQKLLSTWSVVDDLKLLREFLDSETFSGMSADHTDKLDNYILGLISLYDVKFDNTFKTFEKVCVEYHEARRAANITPY